MRQIFPEQSEPAIRAPAIVLGLMGLFIAIHLIRLADPAWDEIMLVHLGFYAGSFWWSWVTYALLHGDWAHLLINSFWMLAFGSVVARRMGAWRFVLFSAICAAAGALPFWYFRDPALLVGASAAISGQMAGAVRLLYASGTAILGAGQAQADMQHVRALTLAQLWRNRRAMTFLGLWAALNLLFGLGAQTQIAWEAHFGGLIAGLLLFSIFDRHRP